MTPDRARTLSCAITAADARRTRRLAEVLALVEAAAPRTEDVIDAFLLVGDTIESGGFEAYLLSRLALAAVEVMPC